MVHVFYCDISTLKCSEADVEQALNVVSEAVYKVKSGLWLFDAKRGPFLLTERIPVNVHEYLITGLLDDFITPESVAFGFTPDQWFYCNLPEAADQFWQDCSEK